MCIRDRLQLDYGVSLCETNSNGDSFLAVKAIDYATAVVETRITYNSYGVAVWGEIFDEYCDTDKTQPRWFYAENPSCSCIDGGRTLRWVGEGDYCATIDGVEYYLSSGIQVTEMYVGNYIN